jgi:hypothetical protein
MDATQTERGSCFHVGAVLSTDADDTLEVVPMQASVEGPRTRPLGHVCGGELLRLDPGGFDDMGSAFALAQHEAREVGLRHAYRFATVFHERGAHSRITRARAMSSASF